MVNYCCVYGCGRNSRLNKHLNYYGLPKERHRQVEWLKAAGRDDLLTKDQMKVTASHRFCSRHFTPSSIKNRHLCADAMPTLSLPGVCSDEDSSDEGPLPHADVVCDHCGGRVVGRRYKCVSCPDYDLCQKCEMLEAHPDHFMLRIPKPMKFKLADNLIKKWRRFFQAEHVTPSGHDQGSDSDAIVIGSESSDDEPITKYAKNYDSGVDLSEDVKKKIRNEVTRVLKLKPEKKAKVTKKIGRKRAVEETEKQNEKPKSEQETTTLMEDEVENVMEVVFADVNEIKNNQIEEFKPTILNSLLTAPDTPKCIPPMFVAPTPTTSQVAGVATQQPTMQVKLSDDLTELMIEVTSNNQKTVYKYTEG